ncbi:hypothetical protein BT96DRAFT_940649 [Gymnopus androsaceus JB14]|uniref:Uncharacterized protein n=1 Tax=Gymnopus androsaceus JB14 TaxID=1447944 RepID=A0A6A4HL26_9AGAR|nr:hypothetical protein BT96DRAFT_940649 [Gymnopus androsaceus JB14]
MKNIVKGIIGGNAGEFHVVTSLGHFGLAVGVERPRTSEFGGWEGGSWSRIRGSMAFNTVNPKVCSACAPGTECERCQCIRQLVNVICQLQRSLGVAERIDNAMSGFIIEQQLDDLHSLSNNIGWLSRVRLTPFAFSLPAMPYADLATLMRRWFVGMPTILLYLLSTRFLHLSLGYTPGTRTVAAGPGMFRVALPISKSATVKGVMNITSPVVAVPVLFIVTGTVVLDVLMPNVITEATIIPVSSTTPRVTMVVTLPSVTVSFRFSSSSSFVTLSLQCNGLLY